MKKISIIIFSLLSIILCGAEYSAFYSKAPITNIYKCQNIRVKDADTFTCDFLIVDFDVILMNQTIRAEGFDACESSKRRESVNVTDEEVKIGKEAKLFVEQLVIKYDLYVYPNTKTDITGKTTTIRDPYGRIVGTLWLKERDKNNFFLLKDIIFEKGYDRSQFKGK